MPEATLLLAGAVDGAIALLLLYVGWTVTRRPVSTQARTAAHAFATWWGALGYTVFVNAAKEIIAGLGAHESLGMVALLNGLQYTYIVATCLAVWGLLYYLVYLFTGNARWFVPLTVGYALYAIVALLLVAAMRPDGVTAGKWFVGWTYRAPTAGGAFLVVMTLLLLLPQIGAAFAYLRIASKTSDPLVRYRVRMVSWSLIFWLGLTLLAPFLRLGQFEWWQAGGRLVGLAAAIVILLAYRPPAFVRERLGTEAV